MSRTSRTGIKHIVAAALAAAGVGAASGVWATPTYRLVELPFNGPPDDPFNDTGAVSINGANQMAVNFGGPNGTSGQRCTRDSCEMVPPLYTPHWPLVWADAINEYGQVLATSADVANTIHALVYDGTNSTPINGFPDDFCNGCTHDSYGHGLNKQGQAVGSALGADGRQRAFLWTDGVTAELPTLGGGYSVAYGINNRSDVVGLSTTAGEAATHAFLYSRNRLNDLGTLGGTWSVARAINGSRQVVGCSTLADGTQTRGFLYAAGTMSELPSLGGSTACAHDINRYGQIVGEAEVVSGVTHGFLIDEAGIHDLNDLLSAKDRVAWTIVSAGGINSHGVIAATGQKVSNGVIRALMLRPRSTAPAE